MNQRGADPQPLDALLRLLAVLRRLPDPAAGCLGSGAVFPFARALCSREAYEVVSAIESRSDAALCDELGDLLFQVVFHAQLAAEQDF